MVKYIATIESHQPQGAVFDYLSDFSSARDWDPNIESAARIDSGPIREGSQFKLVSNFLGRHVELVYEITQIEAPTMFVVRADGGGFYSEDTILVEAQAGGCTVQYQAVLGFRGFGRLFSPLWQIIFNRIGGKAKTGLNDHLNRTPLPALPQSEA
mgnify:CR=1 FL=1